MARRVLMAEESEGLLRDRPRLGGTDVVKVVMGIGKNRGMTVEVARQCGKDRKE